MRGVKRTFPLYIECRRQGCGKLKEVRRPADQKKPHYCSQRCNAIANKNILHCQPTGVANSVTARKRRVIERVAGLTPLEAFKVGYLAGLRAKLHKVRSRYVLMPRQQPLQRHVRMRA